MVEIMKIMVTSFKRSHAGTAARSAPNPAAGHTSTRDSWTLMGKSGSVSCGVTAPFSWVLVHKALFLPSKGLFPQSCVSSGSSMVGLMATASKRVYAIPRSAIMINKRVCNAVLGCNLKNDRMISVCFQGKSLNIIAIQVYAPTTMLKKVIHGVSRSRTRLKQLSSSSSRYLLTSYVCIPVPYNEKDIFFGC